MKALRTILLALLYGSLVVGCTEVSQILNPSPVDVSIAPTEATPTDPTSPGAGASGTITLDPAAITVAVGKTVFVTVIVKDSTGKEIPSEDIRVDVLVESFLRHAPEKSENRVIAFEGLASGVTSVIVTASGLQTSLVATVSPLAQSSVAILS